MRPCAELDTTRDHGQAVTLLIALVALATVLVVGIGSLATRIVERTRAQTAADAAALAATWGGRAAAARLATANGAILIGYRTDDDEVLVTVNISGEQATARATNGP